MRIIPYHESLTCEFKSDRWLLPLNTLIEAVICMANGSGGAIYLGVEDNGLISGLHPQHRDLQQLERLVCQYTLPHLAVKIEPLLQDSLVIAKIQIPISSVPIATIDGRYKRRQLQPNGEPECVKYRPTPAELQVDKTMVIGPI